MKAKVVYLDKFREMRSHNNLRRMIERHLEEAGYMKNCSGMGWGADRAGDGTQDVTERGRGAGQD